MIEKKIPSHTDDKRIEFEGVALFELLYKEASESSSFCFHARLIKAMECARVHKRKYAPLTL